MKQTSTFSRRGLRWAVGLIGGSLILALGWGIFGPDIGWEKSVRPNSFSRSAIGHHAFVALLGELDIPVTVSRFDSGAKAGRDALLVVAEPTWLEHERESRELRTMLRRAQRSLLVLPKWTPVDWWQEEDTRNRGWVRQVEMLELEDVAAVLEAVDVNTVVVRPTVPVSWNYGELGAAPNVVRPQLIAKGTGITPIVDCEMGILFGRLRVPWGTVYVLADPDVIANHGLARPGNAAFLLRALDFARYELEAVVLDETAHGFARNPSLYRALFEYPLVLPTIQALLTLLVLLWAAMGRFGAPRRVKPAIEAGKGFLIDNIATMLRFGGHAQLALRRYLTSSVADVRQRLHVPTTYDEDSARAWLDRNAAARKIPQRLDELTQLVADTGRDGARALHIARLIHQWREEMIHGRGKRT